MFAILRYQGEKFLGLSWHTVSLSEYMNNFIEEHNINEKGSELILNALKESGEIPSDLDVYQDLSEEDKVHFPKLETFMMRPFWLDMENKISYYIQDPVLGNEIKVDMTDEDYCTALLEMSDGEDETEDNQNMIADFAKSLRKLTNRATGEQENNLVLRLTQILTEMDIQKWSMDYLDDNLVLTIRQKGCSKLATQILNKLASTSMNCDTSIEINEDDIILTFRILEPVSE